MINVEAENADIISSDISQLWDGSVQKGKGLTL